MQAHVARSPEATGAAQPPQQQQHVVYCATMVTIVPSIAVQTELQDQPVSFVPFYSTASVEKGNRPSARSVGSNVIWARP
jgi:hypothetical protein